MAVPHPVSIGLGRSPAMDELVRELCTSEMLNSRYLLQMPVVTAFGSAVSVSVWPEGGGETFMVSDDGLAYHEITTAMGSERIFSRVAKAKSDRYGAQFDGCSMLFIRVNRERLKGAVIAMASLTKEVIDETIEKSFAAKVSVDHERFLKKVASAFPGSNIREHASVTGQSTTSYEIDALVETEGQVLAFDYFSKAGNSVNSAYATLSDIARLEDGPKPIGVTNSFKAIGSKLMLISSVAKVIEAEADVKDYQRLAA